MYSNNVFLHVIPVLELCPAVITEEASLPMNVKHVVLQSRLLPGLIVAHLTEVPAITLSQVCIRSREFLWFY